MANALAFTMGIANKGTLVMPVHFEDALLSADKVSYTRGLLSH